MISKLKKHTEKRRGKGGTGSHVRGIHNMESVHYQDLQKKRKGVENHVTPLLPADCGNT